MHIGLKFSTSVDKHTQGCAYNIDFYETLYYYYRFFFHRVHELWKVDRNIPQSIFIITLQY